MLKQMKNFIDRANQMIEEANISIKEYNQMIKDYEKKGFFHIGAEASQAIGTGKKPYSHYMLPRQEASPALLMLKKL